MGPNSEQQKHYNPCFTTTLTNSSDWLINNISESQRAKDMKEALAFVNHKGASLSPELLTYLVKAGVTHGFAVPFSLAKMQSIPGILLAPLNIQDQKHHQ